MKKRTRESPRIAIKVFTAKDLLICFLARKINAWIGEVLK